METIKLGKTEMIVSKLGFEGILIGGWEIVNCCLM